MERRRLCVVFVHPDLGLGGAERLVVDAALGLQALGHETVIYTAHLDRERCFEEVRSGKVRAEVVRWVFWVMPRSIAGRFHAILAAMRCALIAVWVVITVIWTRAWRWQPGGSTPPLYGAFCDIVSLPVVVFALAKVPTLFYCHYPDKLLRKTLIFDQTDQRKMIPMDRAYRGFVDWLEQVGISWADQVLVNSHFTADAFVEAFPTLATAMTRPQVVYPAVELPISSTRKADFSETPFILSVNRFERKKNVELAIHALAKVNVHRRAKSMNPLRLIAAGGYDSRLAENQVCMDNLKRITLDLGLSHCVDFRTNISEQERGDLFRSAVCVVYTPQNEHFGIVPLEAMAHGVPVVACNNGGPVESISHNETGFLCDPTPDSFAKVIEELIQNPERATAMGEAGRQRIAQMFSVESLARGIETAFLQSAS
mmetsp:Transcript_3296/g.6198  ORF Transcript_3296/g.6198 Transcript_3296/m.6198 type:complete len:427 (-) Transcript_3296:300-1580(-)